MRSNARWEERIGAVFLPEADVMEVADGGIGGGGPGGISGFTPDPEGPNLPPGIPRPGGRTPIMDPNVSIGGRLPLPFPYRVCRTQLKQGCYTLHFTPNRAGIFSSRYRGTLRVELTGGAPRISGDLYRYRLLEVSTVGNTPIVARDPALLERLGSPSDEAADTTTIPIYSRRSYNSYLRGTSAQLFGLVLRGSPCWFSLDFDQFNYVHPATGFSGSFPSSPSRRVRFVLNYTRTADLFSGQMYELLPSGGTSLLGTVSIRWISPFYRRADLQLNTLTGAVTPPASVSGSDFHSIFADAGWDVTVHDGGGIQLPAALSGVTTTACWSEANLHTLMQSVPGYNAADLDTTWRVHLVVVPAALGCSRGIMFDSSIGADPNSVPREGSATFSHDGYPANEVPDGMGGSHYDTAANQQQRNVPRAYLRSATHEVGHAFNQIHQGFEAGNDNSIMTPTPSVASVIGTGGTFPDAINLAFNDRVKRHLRHYPDPAVRPGGMDFFGSAVAAPEPADVDWVSNAHLDVTPSTDRVSLGEPITLQWTLTNDSDGPIAVPDRIDAETLLARVNVTDPNGRITFMRPPVLDACFTYKLVSLEPGASATGTTTLFWGKEGFAFDMPGRHRIEVVVLWTVAGAPVAASGEADVFVSYPLTGEDNDVAALMLHPEVGKAVAAGDASGFSDAAERLRAVLDQAGSHGAAGYLRDQGVVAGPSRAGAAPKKAGARKAGAKKAAKKSGGNARRRR